MKGETIFNAAHIISETCRQIDAMFQAIEPKILELEENSFLTYMESTDYELKDKTGWLDVSYMDNYEFAPRRSKRTIHIAFCSHIYNTAENKAVNGWEPSLYVMIAYCENEIGWDLDNNNFNLHSAISDGYNLKGQQLWTIYASPKDYGCTFVVPLVAISDERTLHDKIITPAFRIAESLAKSDSMEKLDAPSIACRFTFEEDQLTILK
ncbi:hypothetical protein [Pseudodesulfovibrio methanolicus]|uniref:Uncharacterized protein n=1 Tax=Pseudodesulfovibrio methanolicus TaxID=3126690 RepID=A0ABZ2J462_9BACT